MKNAKKLREKLAVLAMYPISIVFVKYYTSKKSLPILYNNSLYEMVHDFFKA